MADPDRWRRRGTVDHRSVHDVIDDADQIAPVRDVRVVRGDMPAIDLDVAWGAIGGDDRARTDALLVDSQA